MITALRPSEADDRITPLVRMATDLFAQRYDGFFVYDTNLIVLAWNPRLEELSARPCTGVIGRSLLDAFPQLREAQRAAALQEPLLGRMLTQSGECWLLADREICTRYDSYFLPLLHEGKVAAAAGIVRDRVGVQATEERLLESELRFRTMADCAPVLLWMAGADGRCEFFNQTWLKFRGRSMAQEYGFGWAEGIHPQEFQICMDTYMDAFRERRAFEMVYRLRRHDGVYRWILDHGAPRYSPEGGFAGYIGSCTDITDRKDAEDALHVTSGRLTRSNAELERFAYAASHDLQEPLRMVTNYTAMLAEKYRAMHDAETDQYIGFAIDGARRMKDIIDGLLSLARLKHMDPKSFGKVDCDRIVKNAIQSLQLSIAEASAELHVSALPTVRGHSALLGQVFQNLIHNAIKFRRDEPPVIAIKAESNDGTWCISVTDNGIGMEMQYAERVFVVFQRLHSRSEYPGSGIGLALCKQVVELHGGRIWLTAEPGRGTTVSLTLPPL
jgi:PAS domain S-box-containing protein